MLNGIVIARVRRRVIRSLDNETYATRTAIDTNRHRCVCVVFIRTTEELLWTGLKLNWLISIRLWVRMYYCRRLRLAYLEDVDMLHSLRERWQFCLSPLVRIKVYSTMLIWEVCRDVDLIVFRSAYCPDHFCLSHLLNRLFLSALVVGCFWIKALAVLSHLAFEESDSSISRAIYTCERIASSFILDEIMKPKAQN